MSTKLTKQTSASQRRNVITHIICITLSAIIQLGLLLYAQHVDSHPERYGGLKYTDVDWRVISDGTRLIFDPDEDVEKIAKGWLVRTLGLKIGDPYERSTFRYTPLLPLLISPTLVHPLLGKSILVIASLLTSNLLLSLSGKATWLVHSIWTLNPLILNINTRGSPESIICLLVVLTLYHLKRGNLKQAAVWLGISASWKIYPVIYVPAIWSYLAMTRGYGWFGKRIWIFGGVVGGTMVVINGLLWSIWGRPFIHHTYLYHLTRLDHRHNFSPYFYPIYLSFFPSPAAQSPSTAIFGLMQRTLRHPLTSFLPQNTLVLLCGFALHPTSLEFTMFVQTTVFVVFNKVCTSQYFMWFIPFLPLIIPQLHLSRTKTITIITLWIAGQAAWLGMAYQLELLARQVYLPVWMAGLGLFGISIWVVGEILDGYHTSGESKSKSE
ncbi:hypothetical protein I302_104991 [Kwoniella bestiolae CBS 10118]|uniref:GPI mannosyltransferase 1 n=1 Tax=Kwoniella bestiolae CBS 10118 TaxID=1296100 RepID=A0A1B9FR72_9TREE|nr:hypothetical protein I302_08937 [Kwoniella bestiolae CBS 10118]OCF21265.1 hypothetical protein I302_08937 [Kwoniella bestiolae CBS 10118]